MAGRVGVTVVVFICRGEEEARELVCRFWADGPII